MSEVRWYHLVGLGALGAGSGYMLLKDRVGALPSVIGGALTTTLVVLAFRPGGWLRSDMGAVRARPRRSTVQVTESQLGPNLGAGSLLRVDGTLKENGTGALINGTIVVRRSGKV
ncbi:MAG: hypothetical protein ABH877_02470, partial [bacterium]